MSFLRSSRTVLAQSLALSACALTLSACGGGGGSDGGARALDLTILHINDHHSHLDAETTTLTLKDATGTPRSVTVDQIASMMRVSRTTIYRCLQKNKETN